MAWIFTATMAVLFILFFIIYTKKTEKKMLDYESKITASQLAQTSQVYMEMRGWKHDYHNHMQKIRAHLALGEYAEADEYINLMENELDSVGVKYKTGNTSVDAMLNSKLSLAGNKGLSVKCDAILPDKLLFNPVDLCIIIGNLIDNAIEACEKMEEDQNRFIRIYLCVQKKHLYISVSNATNEVVRKLDREYITNKRGNHGNGLWRINTVVEKHNGYINRQNEPGIFATEIMLPLG